MPGTPDLIAAYEDLTAARPAVEEADAMFEGDVGEVYASERVKLLLARSGANKVEEFNYAHIPVTTVSERLLITGVTVVQDDEQDKSGGGQDGSGVPDAPATATAAGSPQNRPGAAAKAAARGQDAQAAVDGLWKDNQLDAEADGLHLRASRNGDAYLIVWPKTDDAGKVTAVDMRVNSAMTTRVIYDAEDPLLVAYAIKSWTYDDTVDGKKCQRTRANLYYEDRVERWISLPDKKGPSLCDADNWVPYEVDDQAAIIEHGYGRVPVFHFRNDRPYGRPEHLFAYGPQQLLNKLVQALAASVDYQSFPQRYALMDPTADQPMGNFLDPNHPEDDDDPEGDGNLSQLSADPSAMWRIWGARSAGQFDPASPDTFLKPFDRFVQAMAELTKTPLYRFGSAFAQTPSGAALRQADAPTINKVEARQAAYDAVWEDALTFALELLGYNEAEVKVSWKPADQATGYEEWSVVDAKIRAGVPQRQALIEAGYTEDQVDEWLSGEAATNAALLRKVETLTAVADALQALGAAVTMGVITEPQVGALVADLLGPGPVEDATSAPAPAG